MNHKYFTNIEIPVVATPVYNKIALSNKSDAKKIQNYLQ
jgi:hypothetical protein